MFALSAPALAAWNTNIDMTPGATSGNLCTAAQASWYRPNSGGLWATINSAFDGVVVLGGQAATDPGYGSAIGQYFTVDREVRRIFLYNGGWTPSSTWRYDINAVAIAYSDTNNPLTATIVGVFPAALGANSYEIPSYGAHKGWWLIGRGMCSSLAGMPYSESTWDVEELEMFEGVATPSPSPSSSSSATPTPAPSTTATPTPGPSTSPTVSPTATPTDRPLGVIDTSVDHTWAGFYAPMALQVLTPVDHFLNIMMIGFVGLRILSWVGLL